MNVPLNPQWTVEDVLLSLVSIATRVGTDAKLFLNNVVMEYSSPVSVGLSPDMYHSLYHVGRYVDMYIQYPNGASVVYLESYPGQLIVKGSDIFCNTVTHILSTIDPTSISKEPVAFFHCPALEKIPTQRLLRLFFREADKLRAAMWLSDEDHNAKMLRITSSWMLDVYTKPIDVELRFPDGGSIVAHIPSSCMYANHKAYSEAVKLLENVELK